MILTANDVQIDRQTFRPSTAPKFPTRLLGCSGSEDQSPRLQRTPSPRAPALASTYWTGSLKPSPMNARPRSPFVPRVGYPGDVCG